MEEAWVLELDCAAAKAVKDALKRLGWLDSSRKPGAASCTGGRVGFPVTLRGASELVSLLQAAGDASGCCVEWDSIALEQIAKCGGSPRLVARQLPRNPRQNAGSPGAKLKKEVALLLEQRGLDQSLLDDLPTRWEKIGDLGVLPANALKNEVWCSLGASVWKIVADCLGVSRLARQGPVASNGTRDSGVEMLLGDSGWVQHRENGIMYCFDATKCMFSSGNVTERSRMGRVNCEGEVVVDLFAGIGYFVLPFLLRARAKHVYACEWNPQALFALRWNLQVNGVEGRCTVIEGDNRLTAPQGVVDRVCLGLLPSSEGSWAVAVQALRPEGGILHVHENVKDSEEQEWLEYLVASLQTLAASKGRQWQVRILHVERVKWYAPHIRHIVADVSCVLANEASARHFSTSKPPV